jgi:hypothetical protein
VQVDFGDESMAAAVSIQQLGRRLKDRCGVAPTVLRGSAMRVQTSVVVAPILFMAISASAHTSSSQPESTVAPTQATVGSHATGFHASRCVLGVRVETGRTHAVSSRHVEGRRAPEIDG